jgi:hypothetical protein
LLAKWRNGKESLPPLHFYRELARWRNGIPILQEIGYLIPVDHRSTWHSESVSEKKEFRMMKKSGKKKYFLRGDATNKQIEQFVDLIIEEAAARKRKKIKSAIQKKATKKKRP